MPNYWLVTPYDAEQTEIFDRAWNYDLEHKTMAMGWTNVGPNIVELSNLDHDTLRDRLFEFFPDRTKTTRGIDATEIKRLYHEVQKDDILLVRRGTKEILAIGKVTKTAYYDEKEGRNRVGTEGNSHPYCNFLGVEWTPNRRLLARPRFGQNTLVALTETEFKDILGSETASSLNITEGQPSFAVGKVYIRSQIHSTLGGQPQGGISTPVGYKVIMLFTGQSGEQHGYEDKWEGNTFLYSGEGQKGDMEFVRGNLEIKNHEQNGKKLLLFRRLGEGAVRYIGEMRLQRAIEKNVDLNGASRKVIQFEMTPVGEVHKAEEPPMVGGRARSRRWIDDVVSAFQRLGGVGHLDDIYASVQAIRTNLPESWREIIRREIENHSSDSEAFTGKEDLFHSVNGLGSGLWSLRGYEDNDLPIEPDIPDLPEYRGLNGPTQRKEDRINRIIRDTKASKEIKAHYRQKCQICGKTIAFKARGYSEAHHLKPLGKGHDGPDVWENMMVLCPNHHAEFDLGSIALNPETLVILHVDEQDPFHMKSAIMKHPIDKEFLEYHYLQIFKGQREGEK